MGELIDALINVAVDYAKTREGQIVIGKALARMFGNSIHTCGTDLLWVDDTHAKCIHCGKVFTIMARPGVSPCSGH